MLRRRPYGGVGARKLCFNPDSYDGSDCFGVARRGCEWQDPSQNSLSRITQDGLLMETKVTNVDEKKGDKYLVDVGSNN